LQTQQLSRIFDGTMRVDPECEVPFVMQPISYVCVNQGVFVHHPKRKQVSVDRYRAACEAE